MSKRQGTTLLAGEKGIVEVIGIYMQANFPFKEILISDFSASHKGP